MDLLPRILTKALVDWLASFLFPFNPGGTVLMTMWG